MKQFVDELDAVGQIPISLVRWELTGEPAAIASIIADRATP